MSSVDSFQSKTSLTVGDKTYIYYDLKLAEANGLGPVSKLPASLKVLLENLLRNEDGISVSKDDILAIARWIDNKGSVEHEISFRPARVLM
jgi:aconitate hydratase